MYIITSKKDIIIKISSTIDYEKNGNVLIDDGTGIAKGLVKKVYEVSDVPNGVKEAKYCYTEEVGFYENKDYIEPVNEKEEIEKLQEQITNLELAITEIFESGV